MGATSDYRKYTKVRKVESFLKKFERDMSDLRYQEGNNSYAGHLGIKSGRPMNISHLTNHKRITKKNENELLELIFEKSGKWEPCVYIKLGATVLIGGLCPC